MPDLDLRLRIAETDLHHHASKVLDPSVMELVEAAVRAPLRVNSSTRTETRAGLAHERPGVTAASLNVALKTSFSRQLVWTFEARIDDGVIFDHRSPQGTRAEGFDLALYDSKANLANLWSLCYGRRALYDGDKVWGAFLSARPDLRQVAAEVAEVARPGFDLQLTPGSPTVLGEIQFANWALVHRDLMKLISAQREVPIDFFVYIVATGALSGLLSSQTVNFANSRETIKQFASLVTVPTWIVGLDLDPRPES